MIPCKISEQCRLKNNVFLLLHPFNFFFLKFENCMQYDFCSAKAFHSIKCLEICYVITYINRLIVQKVSKMKSVLQPFLSLIKFLKMHISKPNKPIPKGSNFLLFLPKCTVRSSNLDSSYTSGESFTRKHTVAKHVFFVKKQ